MENIIKKLKHGAKQIPVEDIYIMIVKRKNSLGIFQSSISVGLYGDDIVFLIKSGKDKYLIPESDKEISFVEEGSSKIISPNSFDELAKYLNINPEDISYVYEPYSAKLQAKVSKFEGFTDYTLYIDIEGCERLNASPENSLTLANIFDRCYKNNRISINQLVHLRNHLYRCFMVTSRRKKLVKRLELIEEQKKQSTDEELV